MNQHEFVAGCLAYYRENDIQPGDPNEGRWETAHYPLPRGSGGETIKLLSEHHQIQGLLQSAEVGRCCFFAGDTKRFLTSGSFVEGWFGLWDLYERWGYMASLALEERRERSRKMNASLTPAERSERSRVAALASHAKRREARVAV